LSRQTHFNANGLESATLHRAAMLELRVAQIQHSVAGAAATSSCSLDLALGFRNQFLNDFQRNLTAECLKVELPT
jgi:hypothetical protein